MKTFRKFLSLILSIFTVLPFVTACDEQKTIGIIGGADGPTAILVSGFGENQPETDDTKSTETESETTSRMKSRLTLTEYTTAATTLHCISTSTAIYRRIT